MEESIRLLWFSLTYEPRLIHTQWWFECQILGHNINTGEGTTFCIFCHKKHEKESPQGTLWQKFYYWVTGSIV